jgi:hypothetical protein
MVALGKSACGGLYTIGGGGRRKKISKPSAKYRRIVGKCFNHKRKRKKKTLATYLESLSLDASLFTPFSVPQHVV